MTGASISTGGLNPGDGVSLLTFGLLATFLASGAAVPQHGYSAEVVQVQALSAAVEPTRGFESTAQVMTPVLSATVEVV